MTTRRFRSLPSLLWFWAITVSALGVLCVALEAICRRIPRLNHIPYSRATFDPLYDYVDFWMFNERFPHFHSKMFFDRNLSSPFLYPAPLAVAYKAVHALAGKLPHHTTIFLLAILATYCVLCLLLFLALKRVGLKPLAAAGFALTSLVTSYPFFFEFNRANMEIVVWLAAAAGVWMFAKDRLWLAAAFIGIAGACKLYPYVYVGLFVARKKYKEAVLALLIGGLTTLISLWATTGDVVFTAHHVSAGVAEFRDLYVLHRRWQEIGLDHSIFGAIKFFMPSTVGPSLLEPMLNIYLVAAGVVATLLFFLKVRKMPFENQVAFLTVASIVLPPASYDYTLLHVYTPWAFLVLYAATLYVHGERANRALWLAFACFAVLLSPQNEIIFHGERLEGLMKCAALLSLLVITIRYPFEPLPPYAERSQASEYVPGVFLSPSTAI